MTHQARSKSHLLTFNYFQFCYIPRMVEVSSLKEDIFCHDRGGKGDVENLSLCGGSSPVSHQGNVRDIIRRFASVSFGRASHASEEVRKYESFVISHSIGGDLYGHYVNCFCQFYFCPRIFK